MIRSSKKKHILTLSVLLLLLCLIVAGFIVSDRFLSEKIRIQNVSIDTDAALKLHALQQISKKNGITKWELTAASATLIKKENKAVLADILIRFFTEDDRIINLRSPRGVLDTETRDMVFSGRVVVDGGGVTLKTDELQYIEKDHIIRSASQATIEKKDAVIKGDSMTVDLNTGTVTLLGQVTGQF